MDKRKRDIMIMITQTMQEFEISRKGWKKHDYRIRFILIKHQALVSNLVVNIFLG